VGIREIHLSLDRFGGVPYGTDAAPRRVVAGKEPGTPGERPSNARVFRGPKSVHDHHFKWGRQSKGAKFVRESRLIHTKLKKGS